MTTFITIAVITITIAIATAVFLRKPENRQKAKRVFNEVSASARSAVFRK